MAAMTLVLCVGVTAQEAPALDVQDIYIFEGTDRVNGAVDDYYFEVEVQGTGINDGVFVCVDTATWYPLTVDPGGDYAWYDGNFASMAALTTTHPNPAQYQIYLNKTVPVPTPADFEDTVLLGFAAAPPTGFATITNPTHMAAGVGTNPTYTWSTVSGMGTYLGTWVCDDLPGDDDIYDQVDTNMTRTSWTPGALDPWKSYQIEVDVLNLTGGAQLNLQMASGDPFVYTGPFEEINRHEFSTVPEPTSVWLVATAVLGVCVRRRQGTVPASGDCPAAEDS